MNIKLNGPCLSQYTQFEHRVRLGSITSNIRAMRALTTFAEVRRLTVLKFVA